MRATRTAREAGATAVEYALMLASVFVFIFVTVGLLGGSLNAIFANLVAFMALIP
jgi:Flp pilus assembly pilin Flp